MQEWLNSPDGQYVNGAMNQQGVGAAVNSGITYSTSPKGNRDKFVFGSAQAGTIARSVLGKSALPLVSAVGLAAEVRDRMQKDFPGDSTWDMKAHLRSEFSLSPGGGGSDKWFEIEGTGQDMYYDVLGNVQFGVMLERWGFTERSAQRAQLSGGLAGDPNTDDNAAVALGYAFSESHPGDFTADDLYKYLTSPTSLEALADAGKIRPTG